MCDEVETIPLRIPPAEEIKIKQLPMTEGTRLALKRADISQQGETIIHDLLVALAGVIDNKELTSGKFINKRQYWLNSSAVEYAELILAKYRKFC